LKNKEFFHEFLHIFLAFHIEEKQGKSQEVFFTLHNSHNTKPHQPKGSKDKYPNFNENMSYRNNFYIKYNLNASNILLPKPIWSKIIFETKLSENETENFFKNLNSLPYFIKEPSTLIQLLSHRQRPEITNEKFKELLEDLKTKFQNCEYISVKQDDNPFIQNLPNVLALLFYFWKEGLSDLSLDDIRKQIHKCLPIIKNNKEWKEKDVKWEFKNNNEFIYEYKHIDEINLLLKTIQDEKDKYFEIQYKELEKRCMENFIYSVKTIPKPEEYHQRDEYFFKKTDVEEFLNFLKNIDNQTIYNLHHHLIHRYFSNQSYESKNDLEFWIDIQNELVTIIQETNKKEYSDYLLEQRLFPLINDIIDKLKK